MLEIRIKNYRFNILLFTLIFLLSGCQVIDKELEKILLSDDGQQGERMSA